MGYAPQKYALITGAAGGMGRIYAEKLAAAGYGLLLVDINAHGLEETAALARERFRVKPGMTNDSAPAIVTATVDLTADDAAKKVRAAADEAGITVDILINNAGMIFIAEICEVSKEKLGRMIALHCTTPLMLCNEFIPEMKKRGWGKVLNISSIAAGMAWPVIGMYGNTKNFVKGYSRELRTECHGSGVSVTLASFGAVDTPLFGFSEKQRKFMKSVGAMISPEKAVEKGLKAMFKGRKSITPGFISHLAVAFVPLIPDWIIRPLYRRFGPALRAMQR